MATTVVRGIPIVFKRNTALDVAMLTYEYLESTRDKDGHQGDAKVGSLEKEVT